jgi:hypothetical protein
MPIYILRMRYAASKGSASRLNFLGLFLRISILAVLPSLLPRISVNAQNISIRTVQFNESPSLYSDCPTDGQYPSYHWINGVGYPALLERNTQPHALIQVDVANPPQNDMYIELKGSVPYRRFYAYSMLYGGSISMSFQTACDTPLPDYTGYALPWSIVWEWRKIDANLEPIGPWQPMGTTDIPTYLALGGPPPAEYNSLARSVVHIACKPAGATTRDQAVAKVWSMFQNGAVATWDNRPLEYYPSAIPRAGLNSQLSELLLTGYADCDAFKQLFRWACRVHGVVLQQYKATPSPSNPDDKLIYIGNWSVDTTSAAAPFPYRVRANTYAGTFTMVGNLNGNDYGDFLSQPGISGQNSPTPGEKIFSGHALASYLHEEYPLTGVRVFFDPSYAKIYSDVASLEANVFAFGRDFAPVGQGQMEGFARLNNPNLQEVNLAPSL